MNQSILQCCHKIVTFVRKMPQKVTIYAPWLPSSRKIQALQVSTFIMSLVTTFQLHAAYARFAIFDFLKIQHKYLHYTVARSLSMACI